MSSYSFRTSWVSTKMLYDLRTSVLYALKMDLLSFGLKEDTAMYVFSFRLMREYFDIYGYINLEYMFINDLGQALGYRKFFPVYDIGVTGVDVKRSMQREFVIPMIIETETNKKYTIYDLYGFPHDKKTIMQFLDNNFESFNLLGSPKNGFFNRLAYRVIIGNEYLVMSKLKGNYICRDEII